MLAFWVIPMGHHRVTSTVQRIKMWGCDDVWVTALVWVVRDDLCKDNTFKLKSESQEGAIFVMAEEITKSRGQEGIWWVIGRER